MKIRKEFETEKNKWVVQLDSVWLWDTQLMNNDKNRACMLGFLMVWRKSK